MHDALRRFSLEGRVAIVTGASSGLGAHFAELLAGVGARVALAARRTDKLEPLARRIRDVGGDARAFELDVTKTASITECLDRVVAWGAPDILVNNAGVTLTKPLLAHDEADFDGVMNTNLKGMWLVALEFARRLVALERGGAIANVASILAERVAGGVAPYAISKAGVLQATKAMALELARHRIRVNALLPGYVVTDLNREFLEGEAGDKLRMRIPSRRFGQPHDLDGALLLMVSDAGAGMSGSSVTVDGAHSVSSL
jgi:NAD(P)-dependent dehydrogenase (short-subunit alcohol dehydrogenase family)